MKKQILFIFFLSAFIANAQNNCPPGSSERKVKCGGVITEKCVPDDYGCLTCWNIDWQSCDGDWNHSGGSAYHATYQACLDDAQRTISGTLYHPCPEVMNKYVYRIYVDGGKLCGTNSDAVVKQDLLNKIHPFLRRYYDEIMNARRYFSGMPSLPGSVVREFSTICNQSEQNVKNFESDYNNSNNKSLDEMQQDYENMQKDEINFQASAGTYEPLINQEKQKIEDDNKKQQAVQQQQAAYQQQQDALKQKQTQDALTKANEQVYQSKVQTIQSVNNGIDALVNTANAYAQQQQAAADEQARLQREADERERQRRNEEELQRKKDQAELEKQNRIKEQKRIADQSIVSNWQNKASDILSGNLSKCKYNKNLTNLDNTSITSVYYIIWNFTKNNGIIVSKPIEIKKSPDGDWILQSDLKKQLISKTNLNLNTTPDGVALKENELYYVIGYIDNADEANATYQQLKQNASSQGYNITDLNTQNTATPDKKDKSFWEE